MDLHERHQLDMLEQISRVRAKARPWRSIIALLLAVAALTAGELGRHAHSLDPGTAQALIYCGAICFFLFGTAAAFGLSWQARRLLVPVIGAAHATVTRYALVLAGIFAVLVIALDLARVPVQQLILGGAVTGVLIGIAAQQPLANLFAGMVLLFARPFQVGDRIQLRAGALYGRLEGTVIDISLTYVRLDTQEGTLFIPNTQALAAAVGPVTGPLGPVTGVAMPAPPPATAPVPSPGAAPVPGTAPTPGTGPVPAAAAAAPGAVSQEQAGPPAPGKDAGGPQPR
jgi:small-conductance mechanosensitive channel